MNIKEILKNIDEPQNELALKWLIDNKKITAKKLENIAICSKNPRILYNIATHIKGVSLCKIVLVLISLKDTYIMSKMINYIEQSDDIAEEKKRFLIKPLIASIGMKAESRYIENIARTSKYGDIKELAKYMTQVTDASSIFYFVRDHHDLIPKDTLEKLSRRVIELNDVRAMCSMAEFHDIPIKEFFESIINNRGKDQDGHTNLSYPYLLAMFATEFCDDEDLLSSYPREFVLRKLASFLVTGDRVNHAAIYQMAIKIEDAPLALVDRLYEDYIMYGDGSSYSLNAVSYLGLLVKNGTNNLAYYAAYKLLYLHEYNYLKNSILPYMKDKKLARKITKIILGENPNYNEEEFKLTRKNNKKMGNNH